MVIQFICRGNAFRSIIAEAYLKSLEIPNLTVLSSGTVANEYKSGNHVNFSKTLELLKKHGIEQYAKDHYADATKQELLDESDIAVCLNKRAYEEARSSFKLPEKTYVWNVTDLGEVGRIAVDEAEREVFAEDAYEEIVKDVDNLVLTNKLHKV